MEQIAVVPRNLLEARGWLVHGYAPLPEGLLALVDASLSFVDREPAETDPTRKQIIPYVLLRRGDTVFATERLSAGNEARLHGRVSVGIGGHINPLDGAAVGVFDGMLQELREEVDVDPAVLTIVPIGVVNDDTNPVGEVHFGVVYLAEVPADVEVAVRETHKLVGEFRTMEWLKEHHERLETWSVFALEGLAE